jgi:hypothetical protein
MPGLHSHLCSSLLALGDAGKHWIRGHFREKSWFFRGPCHWHFWGKVRAPKCHLQDSAMRVPSQVSSSGGGLPGRPRLERVGTLVNFGPEVASPRSLLPGYVHTASVIPFAKIIQARLLPVRLASVRGATLIESSHRCDLIGSVGRGFRQFASHVPGSKHDGKRKGLPVLPTTNIDGTLANHATALAAGLDMHSSWIFVI